MISDELPLNNSENISELTEISLNTSKDCKIKLKNLLKIQFYKCKQNYRINEKKKIVRASKRNNRRRKISYRKMEIRRC